MDSPIFIVGSMRSGSTLLRLVLDSHERIAIGHETGFMGAVAATTQIPGWLHGKEWYARLGWSRDELEERLGEFYGGMFARYTAEQNKSRWGDKTPFHTAHMLQLARIFPSSVFIGIVRHPGAVASSLRDKFHYTFADGLAYWAAVNVEMVQQSCELGPRFTLCAYEDLVTEPERVTRELMAFLGEDWSPTLLEHHRVQRRKGTPRTVEGATDSQDPIATDRADRWRGSATPEDLVEIKSQVAELAEFFGYDAGQQVPPPGSPAREGPLLLTGDQIGDRVTRWEGRVDFTAQRQVVAPDTDLQELAARAARAEAALARVRSRRVVMLSEALRRARKDRTLASLRQVWRAARRRR